MAVRYPLVIDTTDNNKIKELPLNDSLNLSTNSIVNAVNITASGTLTVANLVVDSNSVSINGNPIATVALTNSYTDLSNKPSLFDGQYASLSGRPTIVSTTEDLADVSSTQATNGQALIYNSTSGVYEPGSIADAALDLTSQSISELADVAVISISTNQVLKWTGATFTNSNIAFSELTGTPTTLAGYGITDAQLAGALTDGDIKGSVFADDSTLLVDGVNGSIPYTVIDGRPTVVTDLSNDAGYVTNAQLTSGTLTINVTNQGMHDGDITGSVFGDNSTLLVDGVNSNIPKANIEDSANWDTAFAWGNHASAGYQVAGAPHDGDIEGSVFGDDSTLLVDGVNNIIPSSVVSGTEATNWNTAYSWGDHSVAGYLTSVPAQTFASLTGKPTTVAGYGITDAATTAQGALADSAIQNGGSFDGDVTGSVFGDDSTVLVDGVNNTLHGVVLGGMQEIVGPGVVNLTTTSTEIVTTGTDAYTLANGTYGQIKHIIKIGGPGAATITPASFANGTSVELASNFNCVSLLYTNSGWAVIAAQNITINA